MSPDAPVSHPSPLAALSPAQAPIQMNNGKKRKRNSEGGSTKKQKTLDGHHKREYKPKGKGRGTKQTKTPSSSGPRRKLIPRLPSLDVKDLKGPPIHEVNVVKVESQKWPDLLGQAKAMSGATFKHRFKYQGGKGSLITVHPHSAFGTKMMIKGGKSVMPKLNIATKRDDVGLAPTHKVLLEALGRNKKLRAGARNVLRVLKGTHLSKGLETSDLHEAEAAVELAVELGISELARGGQLGLIHAANLLYLMKHGLLDQKTFLDPDKGFVGAGKGGAERLRQLESDDHFRARVFGRHKSLNTRYFKLLKKKKKEKWGKVSYDNWIGYRRSRWNQRYGS